MSVKQNYLIDKVNLSEIICLGKWSVFDFVFHTDSLLPFTDGQLVWLDWEVMEIWFLLGVCLIKEWLQSSGDTG